MMCVAYQSSRLRMERNVHEDVIWDIHAHPTSNTILTASADASVRIWAFGGGTSTIFHMFLWRYTME